jgi:hypothetical protein
MLASSKTAIESERRRKARYPVQLAAWYRILGASSRLSGAGQTVNMSSSGLLLACQDCLQPGKGIEVTVEWPSLLDFAVPLQLVTRGRIVRCHGSMFGIAFTRYQFRTMKRRREAAKALATASGE